VHQADGFAHCGVGPGVVTRLYPGVVARLRCFGRSAQRVHAALPAAVQVVAQRPKIIGCRPVLAPQNVKHGAACGAIAAGGQRRLLGAKRCQALLRGPEACAQQRAVGTQSQCGRQAPAVRNTACRQQQGFWGMACQPVRQFGHQSQGGAAIESIHPVAAGLRALGDQHLGACFQSLCSLFQPLDLADQGRATGGDAGGVAAGVAKREHHGARTLFERQVQHPVQRRGVLVEFPGDETDADALAVHRLQGQAIFALRPGKIAVAAAHQTQRAGASAGGRQGAARSQRHGRKGDRGGQGKLLREPGGVELRHVPILAPAGVSGSRSTKQAPPPAWSSQCTLPWWRVAIERTRASPRPTPPARSLAPGRR